MFISMVHFKTTVLVKQKCDNLKGFKQSVVCHPWIRIKRLFTCSEVRPFILILPTTLEATQLNQTNENHETQSRGGTGFTIPRQSDRWVLIKEEVRLLTGGRLKSEESGPQTHCSTKKGSFCNQRKTGRTYLVMLRHWILFKRNRSVEVRPGGWSSCTSRGLLSHPAVGTAWWWHIKHLC